MKLTVASIEMKLYFYKVGTLTARYLFLETNIKDEKMFFPIIKCFCMCTKPSRASWEVLASL